MGFFQNVAARQDPNSVFAQLFGTGNTGTPNNTVTPNNTIQLPDGVVTGADNRVSKGNFNFNNDFINLFPEDFQALMRQLGVDFKTTFDRNQSVIDNASNVIDTFQTSAHDALSQAAKAINTNIPLNPFSDEIRQLQFNQIKEQLQRQERDAVKIQQSNLASRGVLGGGQFQDIQGRASEATRQASTEANVNLRTDQEKFNIASNQVRQSAINQLQSAAANIDTKLGAVAAQFPLLNAVDPGFNADISGQLFAGREGRLNQDQLLSLAERLDSSPGFFENLANIAAPFVIGAGGNSGFAQGLSVGLPRIGNFVDSIFNPNS